MPHCFHEVLSLLTAAPSEAAKHELTAVKAAVLGLVEGVTEFLPISSTGHLVVTEKLLHVGTHPGAKDAADTYAITIQSGAILAVVVLYWRRLKEMALGVVGRDPEGRRIVTATFVAFVPAAIVGVALEKAIRDRLFGVWPIIVAWAVGGVVILVFARALHQRGEQSGLPLEAITVRAAVLIGLAQVLAVWPGTSRSLVTILAALLVGYSVGAAIEFSFLLGLLTLGAATAYDLLKHGKELFDAYGYLNPFIGFLVAFISAVIAIRWMVRYLQRHGLEIFGWYRLVVAAIALVLLITNAV
ncbi:MAG: undecaprenyl-diphosphatase [Actinomycetota bacterium]|nr:undecaprenyl-diphosphatase [Actinomycetota bacterium]